MLLGLLSVFVHPWFSIYFFGILPLTVFVAVFFLKKAHVTSIGNFRQLLHVELKTFERVLLLFLTSVHGFWFALPWFYSFHPIGEEYLDSDLLICIIVIMITLGCWFLAKSRR